MVTGNPVGQFVDIDHRFAHENHMINTEHLILFAVPSPFLGILEGLEKVALEHNATHGNVSEEHASSTRVLARLLILRSPRTRLSLGQDCGEGGF